MPESTYFVAYQLTLNEDLMFRVAASVQQESETAGTPIDNPDIWAREHRWGWATQADWCAAVQSAMDTGITAWGSNPSVVTDYMILSYVQGALA
jgi:hypothetical protein